MDGQIGQWCVQQGIDVNIPELQDLTDSIPEDVTSAQFIATFSAAGAKRRHHRLAAAATPAASKGRCKAVMTVAAAAVAAAVAAMASPPHLRIGS